VRSAFWKKVQVRKGLSYFLPRLIAGDEVQFLRACAKHAQVLHGLRLISHAAGILILAHGLFQLRFFCRLRVTIIGASLANTHTNF